LIKLFLFCLLFISVGCVQEEIESYDDLTPDEQEDIRNQSQQKCLNESQENFTNLITSSNSNMASFTRGQYWKVTYTAGSTTSDNYIYVWKVDGTTVYFLYQQLIESTTYHNFIKVTQAFNEEMFDDLLVKKCNYTLSVTQSDSSYSVKFTDVATTEGTTDYKTTTTYSSTSSYPAFFGALIRDVSKKKLDDNGNVASTETFSYKMASVDNDADLSTDYSTYTNAKYCVHNYTSVTPKTFSFPYELNCETSTAVNPNPGTDTTLDFTPTTELVL